MFTTIEQVKELTDYDVDASRIIMAQAIIEGWIGRLESDILNPEDQALLARATAYQAVYMGEHKETVFEQMSVASIGQFGQMVTFKGNDYAAPFIAPLAVIACRRLSWKRMRSVKTGTIYATPPVVDTDWSTE